MSGVSGHFRISVHQETLVLIAFITFGEGISNNFHHEFPDDFRNGIRWFDYDPTKWLISISYFFWIGLESETFRVSSDRAGSSSHDAEGA